MPPLLLAGWVTAVSFLDSGRPGGVETPLKVDADDIKEYLGRQKFQYEVAERTSVPGVATGLAVTGTGGDVLFIEATAIDGDKGSLTLTGQSGGETVLAHT